jgi:hypothetical protein
VFNLLGAFELGKTDTADCPTGTTKMTSAAACELAALVAARPYDGSGTAAYLPTGCVWLIGGGSFYFNSDAKNARRLAVQPVCAGVPDF